jgi:hypothetical protein
MFLFPKECMARAIIGTVVTYNLIRQVHCLSAGACSTEGAKVDDFLRIKVQERMRLALPRKARITHHTPMVIDIGRTAAIST